MKITPNNFSFKDLAKKKYVKLCYLYALIVISVVLVFLLTVINAKAPFFDFAKDERILKNINHFYPQSFSYFTARPDSLIFVEVFKVSEKNELKKINTSFSHSSNYYGLSRINRFNYHFFGNIYNFIPEKNECFVEDPTNLKSIFGTENDYAQMTFGESFFCGKYLILLKKTIPFESRNFQDSPFLDTKYKLVEINCK